MPLFPEEVPLGVASPAADGEAGSHGTHPPLGGPQTGIPHAPLSMVEAPPGSGPPQEEAEEWSLGLAPQVDAPPPVERPALPIERLQAGIIDTLLVLGPWSGAVYFSARVARVSLMGLAPSWPYLVAYLVFLGTVYATYFTGTTGRTPGKMALGLCVVGADGGPPGHLRALLRVILGGLGMLLAGAGSILMFFDPARRGLHDRLLRTRVIKA